MVDIRSKWAETQGALEELIRHVPGYTGYKDKEERREADKQLRMVLAQRFQEQRDRLAEVQRTLTDTGRLASIVTLERSMMKLQLLIDRLRTAAYGYAGFFDAVKVREQQLEALQRFDAAIAEQVQHVRNLIDQLSDAAAKELETGTLANDLIAALEKVNTLFSRRQDVILGTSDVAVAPDQPDVGDETVETSETGDAGESSEDDVAEVTDSE